MKFPSRRQFLKLSAAGTLGTLLGCGGRSSESSGKDNLRIFVYSGGHEATMREVFVPIAERDLNAKITLYPGWWDGIPKLKTAPADDPPFDLMITDATQGYPAAKDGLFAEINLDHIPHHKDLAPASLDHWIFEKRLGLVYPDSVMTLAYNKTTIGEAPTRWAELLRDNLSGRIGFYSHFYMSLFTFAAMLADQSGKAGTAHRLIETQIDEVFRFAKEHRGRVKLWWPTTTDMILALNDQSVAAGNMHSPEYLQALREKPELGAVVPEGDRAMVQVFWAIPAGTKHQELAERAINVLFSEEVQLGFARRGMATSRLDAAMTMADEDPFWKSLYPHTEDQFQRLKYYPYDVYAESWDELADRWDRTILRSE